MRSLLRYCLALLLLIFLACGCLEARRVHGRHYYGKKHSKRMEHHDRRVKSALDCRAHERFVSCGPEPHCEKSCSNLYNPPSCQFDVDNPKCAYPRCICRDGYLLSRLRPGRQKKQEFDKKQSESIRELEQFLEKRDYAGAISLLQHKRKTEEDDIVTNLWLGHCLSHAGDYKTASEVYETMLTKKDCPQDAHLFLGITLFFLAMYEDARKSAEKCPKSPLQNRLLFHVSHKLNDEKKLMLHHSQLKDTIEDQLCLASIHYLRSHYQQAIDIYKKMLLKHKNFLALTVYLALCYYKLDYYDVSMEVLEPYLAEFPDSPISVNLKACNHYRLYNNKAAENELKALKNLIASELSFAKDIILHNTVVFRNGDAALQVLPTLVDVIPEARLNLVIYHLKK
ncbi:tetratricopeptide repeat protein 26-like protein, partial [Aphelenchoides avenae]